VSSGHPAFQAALRDREAPENSWFTFTEWPSEYLSFFGVKDHPQIDSDDPAARAYMIESARHWLELGVDGFRCDYANGPSHAFWSVFRAETRAISPDSVTLGEVVETPALQRTYAGRLDGCLDFLLMQAMRGAFAFETLPVSGLDSFIGRHLAFTSADMVLPSFLDNHDMNRFLWVVRGDTRRLRLAALCQFTLPQPPIVYYGTEVGLSQDRDVRSPDGSGHPEESRLPMLWGQDQDAGLLAFYRELVRFRRASPWLWRGRRETTVADDASGVYAVAISDGVRRMAVVLHLGEGDVTVERSLVEAERMALATDEGVGVVGTEIHLGPWSGAAFVS
jgi:glycosidase